MKNMKNKNLLLLSLILSVYCLAAQTVFGQCDQSTIGGNCVLYVRSAVSPMPSTNLTTYSAKLSIINHRFPTIGSVAVMPAPSPYTANGHVAVVRAVKILSDGKLSLDLQESNWGACSVQMHYNVTTDSRNIQGYYDYRYYNSNEATPQINGLTNFSGNSGTQLNVGVSGAGFDTGSVEGIILGGWCDSFDKCKVRNDVILNKTATSMQVPVTLNSPGTYTLYLFNSRTGKTSNGQQIYIN